MISLHKLPNLWDCVRWYRRRRVALRLVRAAAHECGFGIRKALTCPCSHTLPHYSLLVVVRLSVDKLLSYSRNDNCLYENTKLSLKK